MANAQEKRVSGPALWWGAALLTLALGYADLARGGDTVAPILLVLGYCVLVPRAILAK
jgi:hypothetical protein